MKGKNLKILLPVLVGAIVACILAWAIFTNRIPLLPEKKPWLTVTDDLDREVTILRQPERIISMAPANTEILFALGLGAKVVGITNVCNYPSQTKEKEEIGDYDNPNLEKIIELKPDLILASHGNPTELIDQLERLNYTVVGLKPNNIDDIVSYISMV